MRKVVLVYHAIDGSGLGGEPAVAGSFPITMERFIAQVDGLRERGWAFAPPSRLRHPVERDTVYITGDDGTVDWARNVLPWCEGEGVPTETAVITGVWHDPPIYPIAHQVQVLLSVRDSGGLPRPRLTAGQREYIDRIYAYESEPARRYLKGACNVVFDEASAREFLGQPDAECQALLARRFAEPRDYDRFHLAELGVHTVAHGSFDGDGEGYMAGEVGPCMASLREKCRHVVPLFTLPVKPKEGVSLAPLCDLLRQAGYVGMCHAPGEWNQRDFIVPRVDAKDVEKFFALPRE